MGRGTPPHFVFPLVVVVVVVVNHVQCCVIASLQADLTILCSSNLARFFFFLPFGLSEFVGLVHDPLVLGAC